MKTRSQEWSRFAYERVRQPDSRRVDDKYRTSCMKMPALIHQCGVLQALVFQIARDKSGRLYVDHLAQTYFGDPTADHRKLIERAQRQELESYMAMTRDLADIAQWFRRFAQVELGEETVR